MSARRPLAIRWTMGDVSPLGFEALRLSVWGAHRIFEPDTHFTVCMNSIPLDRARQLAGPLPEGVVWRDVTNELPRFVRSLLGENMAEGAGWKFAPLRLFPDRYELTLDNDVILWNMPDAIRDWLNESHPPPFVIAEDVRRMFGRFSDLCGPEPRNAGIRGLPPGFDLEAALRDILERHGGPMTSELDEQGLQVALVSRFGDPHVVTLDDVAICSPFPPLLPHLGRCGAHFVGLNARRLPWDYEGRSASEVVGEHWQRLRPELYRRIGIRPSPTAEHSPVAEDQVRSA